MGHLEDESQSVHFQFKTQMEPGAFYHANQWMNFLICFPILSAPSCLEWVEFIWMQLTIIQN